MRAVELARYDLIVIDPDEMAGMGGYAFCSWFKQQFAHGEAQLPEGWRAPQRHDAANGGHRHQLVARRGAPPSEPTAACRSPSRRSALLTQSSAGCLLASAAARRARASVSL